MSTPGAVTCPAAAATPWRLTCLPAVLTFSATAIVYTPAYSSMDAVVSSENAAPVSLIDCAAGYRGKVFPVPPRNQYQKPTVPVTAENTMTQSGINPNST